MAQRSCHSTKRIEVSIGHALLERDDGVVRDADVLGTDLRTALRYVAETEAGTAFEELDPGSSVFRMHLERCQLDEEPRAIVARLAVMLAQDVADILTEKAFDTFPELDQTSDVVRRHPPGLRRRTDRRPRTERRDLAAHLVVAAHIGDQVANDREAAHRPDGKLVAVMVDTSLAHEDRKSLDLCRTGTAMRRLTVPTDGEIRCMMGLNPQDGIEHDHAFLDRDLERDQATAFGVPAPDVQPNGSLCHTIHRGSANTPKRSSRM